jgi:hypothetical protein
VHRALARIPKQEADQAREAQLVRLQAVRMLLCMVLFSLDSHLFLQHFRGSCKK